MLYQNENTICEAIDSCKGRFMRDAMQRAFVEYEAYLSRQERAMYRENVVFFCDKTQVAEIFPGTRLMRGATGSFFSLKRREGMEITYRPAIHTTLWDESDEPAQFSEPCWTFSLRHVIAPEGKRCTLDVFNICVTRKGRRYDVVRKLLLPCDDATSYEIEISGLQTQVLDTFADKEKAERRVEVLESAIADAIPSATSLHNVLLLASQREEVKSCFSNEELQQICDAHDPSKSLSDWL